MTNHPEKPLGAGGWGNHPEPAPKRAQPAAGERRDPTTGRALFAWLQARRQPGLIRYLCEWAQMQGGFPGRMVEWDSNQVALALAEARRKLAAIEDPAD
jgi:hypothetical protein